MSTSDMIVVHSEKMNVSVKLSTDLDRNHTEAAYL